MPGISKRDNSAPIKLLFIGASSSGKTGALISLAEAGYNLRVLDFDNGTDILRDYATNPKSQYKIPEPDQRIQYVTLTDKMKPIGTDVICQQATAWPKMVKLLGDWKDDDVSLGPVASWGEQDILVIDSLWAAATAALHYHLSMQGALLKKRTQNEGRRDIYAVHQLIRPLLEMLYSTSIKCNVIVITHITYNNEEGIKPQIDPEKPTEAPNKEGFPAALGRALGPEIPKYFNNMLVAKTENLETGGLHWIHTTPTSSINAKSSAPLRVEKRYKLATGLADYFKAVKGQ